jgi:citrate lyase subunit beta / citryl-CoA lyase
MGMHTPPLEIIHSLPTIAPCEHIAGNEKFALKAFGLQGRYLSSQGCSLVDVTLDLEDGAPIGQEDLLRKLFVTMLHSSENAFGQVGVRIHAPNSSEVTRDIELLISGAGARISYITIPKVRSVREVLWIAGLIEHYMKNAGLSRTIPLHLLIETPEALAVLPHLAALPQVESLDLGLMDFISQLGGAVPAECMRSPGQFEHKLISSIKSQIVLAALGANKIANHNVTVNVRDPEQAYADAYRARHEFGFLRMWSIHPEQIDPIIRGMTPSHQELEHAREIITAAAAANWGPIQIDGKLHDRASFRYYWGVLQRSGESLLK